MEVRKLPGPRMIMSAWLSASTASRVAGTTGFRLRARGGVVS